MGHLKKWYSVMKPYIHPFNTSTFQLDTDLPIQQAYSLHYPQINKEAENAIKTIKNLLMKSDGLAM